jgi:predicted  nucleic acid-binding Zn-ribbon protein
MPHQCTDCGRTFADGSKDMLSGCPDCGGNKFQFRPDGDFDPVETDTSGDDAPTDDPTPPEPPGAEAGSVAQTVGKATAAVRDWMRDDPDDIVVAEDTPATDPADTPDTDPSTADHADTPDTDQPAPDHADADTLTPEQADAPADPSAPETTPPADDDQPDLQDLRAELNDQFESIKILEPGQYELNLMELYEREEHIIALQEDGRYVIDVPEAVRERTPN